MTTRSILVAATADTGKAYFDNVIWKMGAAPNLNMGYASNTIRKMGIGMRFLNVLIPKYSVINTSYITLTALANLAEVIIKSRLCCELSGVPATFGTIANYQARRGTACGGADDTQHTAVISWDGIAAWTLDTTYNTPSLNTPIQTCVTASAMKDIVVFWDDHEARGDQVIDHYRSAYNYAASPTKCPLLYINFTPHYKVFPSIKLMHPGTM